MRAAAAPFPLGIKGREDVPGVTSAAEDAALRRKCSKNEATASFVAGNHCIHLEDIQKSVPGKNMAMQNLD